MLVYVVGIEEQPIIHVLQFFDNTTIIHVGIEEKFSFLRSTFFLSRSQALFVSSALHTHGA